MRAENTVRFVELNSTVKCYWLMCCFASNKSLKKNYENYDNMRLKTILSYSIYYGWVSTEF